MANRIHLGSAWMFALAMVLSLGAIAVGIAPAMNTNSWTLLSAGVLGLITTIAAWALSCQISAAGKRASTSWEQFSSLFTDRMEQFSVMLNVITEQQLLSDRAKSVAFRDKDREALNRAIREEMARGQFDAALVLINDVETAFGSRQEADALRAEVAQHQEAVVRRLLNDASAAIDRASVSEKWDEAFAIANRMAMTYPGIEAMTALPAQVQQRKDALKQQLLARWQEAVARKDIDGSVQVLRQLDMYVTPEEVAQLKDGAMEIFKIRIEHLREQFKQSIQDKRWSDAIATGENIATEFPTSKLAQEMREMMEMLRSKSQENLTATPTGA